MRMALKAIRKRRPFFQTADWLWNPIPASPVLHANSATWVGYFNTGTHVVDLKEFGNTLIPTSAITPATPRYTITTDHDADWGVAFGSQTVPIPAGTQIPPSFPDFDGWLSVNDPITGLNFNLWQARFVASAWQASWGGTYQLKGDGRTPVLASGVGAGFSRHAAVVGAAELTAAAAANTGLNHALFTSTNICQPTVFVYPASKTDGSNGSGVATPIPEGSRVQLDPAVNVDAISGIVAGEKVIAKTLQTHGMYVGDNGGSRVAILCEFQTDANPGAAYTAVGFTSDYFGLTHIPWGSLRVLKNWNGVF